MGVLGIEFGGLSSGTRAEDQEATANVASWGISLRAAAALLSRREFEGRPANRQRA